MTPEGVPSFKLVLVGDGGTGKWAIFEGEGERKKEEEEGHRRLFLLLLSSCLSLCFHSSSAACSLITEAKGEDARGLRDRERV